jgi:aldehyde:ferredoxin oxidoreductase
MVERIARREGLGDLLAQGYAAAVEAIGEEARPFAVEVKNQPYPMHEPRYKNGMAIGYAVSPTGADHVHSLHDIALDEPDDGGFMPNKQLLSMGVLEPMSTDTIGWEKVRASLRHSTLVIAANCATMCIFPGWHINDLAEMVGAATGWSFGTYELMEVGERAATLARIFNLREGFTAEDDYLAERSHDPTRGGALADGGVDREAHREAVRRYYAMSGWDQETGIPTLETLARLDIMWAADYLPQAD